MANSMLGCTGAATARRRSTGLDMADDRGDAAGAQRPDALTRAVTRMGRSMTKWRVLSPSGKPSFIAGAPD